MPATAAAPAARRIAAGFALAFGALALAPAVVIPGHGPASKNVERDLATRRAYLAYLRETMGRAVRDFEPFDEAYAKTDWSRYARLPAFAEANRVYAYGTYLRMEQEALRGAAD